MLQTALLLFLCPFLFFLPCCCTLVSLCSLCVFASDLDSGTRPLPLYHIPPPPLTQVHPEPYSGAFGPSPPPIPTPSFSPACFMHGPMHAPLLCLVQTEPMACSCVPCTTLHGSRRVIALQKAASILPRWMPMLIPPKPWSAPNIGGYLSNQSLIMRVRGSTLQINQLFSQHRQGKLSQVNTLFMPSLL